METSPSLHRRAAKPKLRWFQWSLRSLFMLTLLVAIGMSWLTVTMQNQRKQKAAAEAIEKAGGRVKSEPTWLGKLLRDDSLVRVTYVSLSGTVSHRRRAGASPRVESTPILCLDNTQVTDAGLVHLQGLSQLQCCRSTTRKSPTPGWCISKG